MEGDVGVVDAGEDDAGELHGLRPVHGEHLHVSGGGGVVVESPCVDAAFAECSHELAAIALATSEDGDRGRIDGGLVGTFLRSDPRSHEVGDLVEFVRGIGAFDQLRVGAEPRRPVLGRGLLTLLQVLVLGARQDGDREVQVLGGGAVVQCEALRPSDDLDPEPRQHYRLTVDPLVRVFRDEQIVRTLCDEVPKQRPVGGV